LPFTFPIWQEFYDLLYAIRPEAADLLPASSTTVRSWIVSSYETEKSQIVKSLHSSQSRIHFSLDIWTSPNHLSLLAILAHYTDQSGKLNRALLGLRELEGLHTGENQCRTFLEVIGEYGIQRQTGYLMMDNASNNDTFMDHLEAAQVEAGYRFNAIERRLRYAHSSVFIFFKSFP